MKVHRPKRSVTIVVNKLIKLPKFLLHVAMSIYKITIFFSVSMHVEGENLQMEIWKGLYKQQLN